MEYGECPFILLQIFGAFIQQRAELAANSGSGSGGSTIDLADVGAGLGEQVVDGAVDLGQHNQLEDAVQARQQQGTQNDSDQNLNGSIHIGLSLLGHDSAVGRSHNAVNEIEHDYLVLPKLKIFDRGQLGISWSPNNREISYRV